MLPSPSRGLWTCRLIPSAVQVRDLLQNKARAVSPQLFPLEFVNGVLAAERKKFFGRLEAHECIEKLNLLFQSSIELDTVPVSTKDLLDFSRRVRLTVYEASYLELAARNQLALATLDKTLQLAARQAGVKLA